MKTRVLEHGNGIRQVGEPVHCPECQEITGHFRPIDDTPYIYRCKFCGCRFEVTNGDQDKKSTGKH